jgi:hypothetical protein
MLSLTRSNPEAPANSTLTGASSCRVSQGGWEGRDTGEYVGRNRRKASRSQPLAKPALAPIRMGAPKENPAEAGRSLGTTSPEGPMGPVPVFPTPAPARRFPSALENIFGGACCLLGPCWDLRPALRSMARQTSQPPIGCMLGAAVWLRSIVFATSVHSCRSNA